MRAEGRIRAEGCIHVKVIMLMAMIDAMRPCRSCRVYFSWLIGVVLERF